MLFSQLCLSLRRSDKVKHFTCYWRVYTRGYQYCQDVSGRFWSGLTRFFRRNGSPAGLRHDSLAASPS